MASYQRKCWDIIYAVMDTKQRSSSMVVQWKYCRSQQQLHYTLTCVYIFMLCRVHYAQEIKPSWTEAFYNQLP